MEGVTFALRDSLEIFLELGVPIDEIRASGGGAKSEFWRQIQANVFGRSVTTINAEEGAAYGAALLAGVGAGAHATIQDACAAAIRVTGQLAPQAEHDEAYRRAYANFRELYPLLAPTFARL
jgi:xylulokinase